MRHIIPIEIIELEDGNYHPVVSSVFSDGSTGKWVIDTGASRSIFDAKLSQHIGQVDERTEDLHSAGIGAEPLKSSRAKLKPLLFSKLKVDEMEAAILDLGHINELYARTSDLQICGLLGGDFLLHFKAVIDYRRKRLVLRN